MQQWTHTWCCPCWTSREHWFEIDGFNSAKYIHTLYQVMNLTFCRSWFYYGDPTSIGKNHQRIVIERICEGTFKGYQLGAQRSQSRARWSIIHLKVPTNPYKDFLKRVGPPPRAILIRILWWRIFKSGFPWHYICWSGRQRRLGGEHYRLAEAGTSACIAGKTGIGMSQRMQSFCYQPKENPFNVLKPGQRPRYPYTNIGF